MELWFVNDVGISRNSTVQTNWTLPGVPSSTAQPNISFINTVTAFVTWMPPLDDGGVPLTHYQILQWNITDTTSTNDDPTIYMVNDVDTREWTIWRLSPNSTYTFAVQSINTVGVSEPSPYKTVTTDDPLPCLEDDEGLVCGGQIKGHCHYWNGNCVCHEPYIGDVCGTLNGEELKLKLNGTVPEFDKELFLEIMSIVLGISQERLFIMSVTPGSVIVHLVIQEAFEDDTCNQDMSNGCLDASVYKALLFDLVYSGDLYLRDLQVVAIGEIGVAGYNTTMPAECSTFSDCATCSTTRANCAWCDLDGECAQVITTPGAACNQYTYYDASNYQTCPNQPQNIRCQLYSGCKECSEDSGCGWCPDIKYCGPENTGSMCPTTEQWSLDTCYDTCSANKVISDTSGEIVLGGSGLSYLPNTDCFWQIWPVTDTTATTYLKVIVYFSRLELGYGDIIAVYDNSGIQSTQALVTITANNSESYIDIAFMSETGYMGIYFASDSQSNGQGFTAVYQLKADTVNAFIMSAIIVAMIAGCLCCTCICLKAIKFLIGPAASTRHPRAAILGQGMGRSELQGLRKKDLAKIPVYTYGTDPPPEFPEAEGDECSICLVEFEAGHKCRLLPCSHKFHMECADTWLQRSVSCPLCKQDILALASTPASERPSRARPSAGEEKTNTITSAAGDDATLDDDDPQVEMIRFSGSDQNSRPSSIRDVSIAQQDALEQIAQGSDGTVETLAVNNQNDTCNEVSVST
mmetsp:Transcript_13342/g.17418  ORF Transcript_13342/g.17418 Transcript_13342/m.17418 type:complete len:747 (-) Transcript_13342:41-2281(-)